MGETPVGPGLLMRLPQVRVPQTFSFSLSLFLCLRFYPCPMPGLSRGLGQKPSRDDRGQQLPSFEPCLSLNCNCWRHETNTYCAMYRAGTAQSLARDDLTMPFVVYTEGAGGYREPLWRAAGLYGAVHARRNPIERMRERMRERRGETDARQDRGGNRRASCFSFT
ncbi:hypothetical protein LZ30DRAFT_298999 [Colletotrichum cereale]|nr:hypothetical protein LZ30DRAFT_298999 [Colletotrichum cereale]